MRSPIHNPSRLAVPLGDTTVRPRNFLFHHSTFSMGYVYVALSCRDVYPNFSLYYSAQSVVVVHPQKHPVSTREKEEQCSAAWNAQGKRAAPGCSARSSAVTW